MNLPLPMLVCGNWKLNLSRLSTVQLIDELSQKIPQAESYQVIVAPVAPFLAIAQSKLENSAIKLAAQNVFYEDRGAFTGEWSALQLKDVGCSYAIVGHSERRAYFCETNESVAKKVVSCARSNIVPICCVGESLKERQSNQVESALKKQLEPVCEAMEKETLSGESLVLAYEPLWAIGTGRTPLPAEIDQTHQWIRKYCQHFFKGDRAYPVRILYGGSVSPENTKAIVDIPSVDGVLVGGASLQAESFLSIVSKIAAEAEKRRTGSI